jgi:hypothetical protein
MVLSNLMQGAHQSDPEKTSRIYLFEDAASVLADSKEVVQF